MTEQTMTPDEVLAAIKSAEYNFAPGSNFACVLRNTRTAVATLIDREAAYRNALEHIAGSCEGRAADVASVALKYSEVSHG